ncbi:MAG: hypothetical protein IT384_20450 [Deltaproteobacteria bacterium]|nr:hypothetical protein [Deltaproteobacteria bacterium]
MIEPSEGGIEPGGGMIEPGDGVIEPSAPEVGIVPLGGSAQEGCADRALRQ